MYDDESDDDNIALNFTLTHESFENDLCIRHVISMASHEHDNVYNNRQLKLLFEQFVQPNKKKHQNYTLQAPCVKIHRWQRSSNAGYMSHSCCHHFVISDTIYER